MRALIAAVLIGMLTHAVIAEEVFDDWMIFPGPNPEPADLLQDSDPSTAFRIGHIIFDYPQIPLIKDDQPVEDLSKLPLVADVVKAGTPGIALDSLVSQQLITPHNFDFESATILDGGDYGFRWILSYRLLPKQGGFSGMPFQYRVELDGRGNLCPPRLTVFDAFFHSPKEGWTYSLLNLPTGPATDDTILTAEKVRSRATKSLLDAEKLDAAAANVMKRMTYHNQKVIQIPISADATGKLIYADIWAVNFRDPSRKEHAEELLTVWVTADGRTAHIKRWNVAGELLDEFEPE